VNVQDFSIMKDLARVVCDDVGIPLSNLYSQYHRGESSKARQIFSLAATDAGLPHLAVSSFLGRDPSYVTQVRRRKHRLRGTTEYHHAFGYIKARLEHAHANP
jgi:hypothetical protein